MTIKGLDTRILSYIRRYNQRQGFPPCFRDIMDGLKISSTSVVNYHLVRLEKQGKIEMNHGKARGIVVKEDTK